MSGELTTLTTAAVLLPAAVQLLPARLWHAPAGEAVDEDEPLRTGEDGPAAGRTGGARACSRRRSV